MWVPSPLLPILPDISFPSLIQCLHMHEFTMFSWIVKEIICRCPECSLCISLLCHMFPCEPQVPWTPWPPKSISSVWGTLPASAFDPHPCKRKFLPAGSCSSFVCFLSLWGYFPILPNLSCVWNHCFMYFVLLIVIWDGRVNPVWKWKLNLPGFF